VDEADKGGLHIQSALDGVISQLGNVAGDRPIAIVAAYPAHFPALACDDRTFRSAIGGLLSHILKNTQRDEVRVRVQLIPNGQLPIPGKNAARDRDVSSGPWGLISISDIEGGLSSIPFHDPDSLKGASDPYPPFDECESLIKEIGGIIWVEHQEALTQTIWVALPIMATSSTSADISSVREAVGTHLAEGDAPNKSVHLCTEDDLLGQQLVQELVNAGYRADQCNNPAEIISMAHRDPPDLIILDLQAREPSAFDLARLIKQDPVIARIPLLFLATIPDSEGGYRLDTASFIVRAEGTGAMLASIHTALSSGVPPAARVLVVESEDALREQMIVHIQAHGHPVVEAASAEEALALIERTRIGVVMVNAVLAQGRDYWLIRQIKRTASEIKIYVVSDSLSAEAGEEAILRGATGFGDTGRLPELLQKMEGDRKETDNS
jgi:DNA-binding response OmpR family regulator